MNNAKIVKGSRLKNKYIYFYIEPNPNLYKKKQMSKWKFTYILNERSRSSQTAMLPPVCRGFSSLPGKEENRNNYLKLLQPKIKGKIKRRLKVFTPIIVWISIQSQFLLNY
jgi:hypothetical protein